MAARKRNQKMEGDNLMVDIQRFKGQMVLQEISSAGQKKISESKVAVVGLGGTGSMASELFCRMGVGTLLIYDHDNVSVSNLHRQILYSTDDVGMNKADAAMKHLSDEGHVTRVMASHMRIDGENIGELSSCDLIFDGTDNLTSRSVINSFSVMSGIPWVMCSAIEYYGQAKGIIPGKTSCLACLNFPTDDSPLSCSDTGIYPPAVTAISSIAVGIAISILINANVSGDLFTLDMRTLDLVRVRGDINPRCSVCHASGITR